jgi:hypothetical protein
VEIVVVSFPSVGQVARIGPLLRDLVSAGQVSVVDAILVSLNESGSVVISDLNDSLVPAWTEISRDPHPLISSADAEFVAEHLDSHRTAIIVAVEPLWSSRLAQRAEGAGGLLELHARIDQPAVDVAARISV